MSDKPNDGGPAFPCDWKDFQPCTGEQVVREQFPGMTLRDWFAGQALAGLCANPEIPRHGYDSPANVSKTAYEIAWAMLKAREL